MIQQQREQLVKKLAPARSLRTTEQEQRTGRVGKRRTFSPTVSPVFYPLPVPALHSHTFRLRQFATPAAPPAFATRIGAEPTFYYFAYGSCMCPVDLKRSLGENTHPYVIGSATLKGYRLGFYYYSALRRCGALDIVTDAAAAVHGVLYKLPWRLSQQLDDREAVQQGGYRHELVDIHSQGKVFRSVRTYVAVNKLPKELPPNDWYFSVVLRGAITCGLPEHYCWQLFDHMHQLQQQRYKH